MNIVFFATPDFAIPSLEAILKSNHKVLAVVTNTDKEQGRGYKLTFSPIKKFALEHGLSILQPESLKDNDFIDKLKSLNADVFVIVAFKILPKEVFTIPKYGSFNLHGSILPKYRGAAPIQWALINGDKETGLTTFFLKEKVDTGNIILTTKVEIDDDDNFGTLHDKMSIEGAKLVINTLELINKGNVIQQPQDDSIASLAPKITKEICKIDLNKTATEIHNLIRGLSPYPGAILTYNGKNYKIFKTKLTFDKTVNKNDILVTKQEIFLGCYNSVLQILEIQPEGRKKMSANEFLRGYKF